MKNKMDKFVHALLVAVFLFSIIAAISFQYPISSNPGLRNFYTFDNTLNDTIGNNNFSNNAGSFNTGRTGNGYFFNGTQNVGIHQLTPSPNGLFDNMTIMDNYTIEFWFNPNHTIQTLGSGTKQLWIMQKDNLAGAGTNYLGFYTFQTTTLSEICFETAGNTGAVSVCTDNKNYPSGTWYHIAAVHLPEVGSSPRNITIYLNGIKNSTKASSIMLSNFSGFNFTIGDTQAGTGGSNGANGTMDNLMIWNITRTQTEIQSDMNAELNSNITITLISPSNASIFYQKDLNLSVNISSSSIFVRNLTNATISVWNSSNFLINNSFKIINGQENITNFTLLNLNPGSYLWNVQGCDGVNCNISSSNRSFRIDFIENNQSFTTPVLEFSQQTFGINISYDNITISAISATLNYNGSSYTGSTSDTGADRIYSRTITIPAVTSQQVIPFYWAFQLTDTSGSASYLNSSFQNQTVDISNFSQCGVGARTVNFTMYEESTSSLVTSTFNATFNWRFNFDSANEKTASFSLSGANNYQFCINVNQTFIVDSDILIDAPTMNRRLYQFRGENYTNVTTNQKLFMLNSTSGTNFIIEFKDAGLTPLQNHEIKIYRFNPGTGIFTLVENKVTDVYGQITARLIEGDVKYKIEIYDEGDVLVKVIDSAFFTCRTSFCTVQFVLEDTNDIFQRFGASSTAACGVSLTNYQCTLSFSNTTNTFLFTWTDNRGQSSVHRLLITKYLFNGTTILFNTTSSNQSSSLSFTVGSGRASYQVQAYRKAGVLPEFRVALLSEKVGSIAASTFGKEGLLWSLILLFTMVLVGSYNPSIGVVFYLVGFIFLGIANVVFIDPAIVIAELILGVFFIWAFRS